MIVKPLQHRRQPLPGLIPLQAWELTHPAHAGTGAVKRQGRQTGGHRFQLNDAEGFIAAIRRQHQQIRLLKSLQLGCLRQTAMKTHLIDMGRQTTAEGFELKPVRTITHHIQAPGPLHLSQSL